MYLDFAATSKISQIWIDSIIESNSKDIVSRTNILIDFANKKGIIVMAI